MRLPVVSRYASMRPGFTFAPEGGHPAAVRRPASAWVRVQQDMFVTMTAATVWYSTPSGFRGRSLPDITKCGIGSPNSTQPPQWFQGVNREEQACAAAAILVLGVLASDRAEPGTWANDCRVVQERYDLPCQPGGDTLRAVLATAGLTPAGSSEGYSLEAVRGMIDEVVARWGVPSEKKKLPVKLAVRLIDFCKHIVRRAANPLNLERPPDELELAELKADSKFRIETLRELDYHLNFVVDDEDGTAPNLIRKACKQLILACTGRFNAPASAKKKPRQWELAVCTSHLNPTPVEMAAKKRDRTHVIHGAVAAVAALRRWTRNGRIDVPAEIALFEFQGLPNIRKACEDLMKDPSDDELQRVPLIKDADKKLARAAAAALVLGTIATGYTEDNHRLSRVLTQKREELEECYDKPGHNGGASMRAVLAKAGLTPPGSSEGYSLEEVHAMIEAAPLFDDKDPDLEMKCGFMLLALCKGFARRTLRNPREVPGWEDQEEDEVGRMVDNLGLLHLAAEQITGTTIQTFHEVFATMCRAMIAKHAARKSNPTPSAGAPEPACMSEDKVGI
ncbi:unnamed protein product [Pedinophyceae sp. YPF-701]|nr:unnamed protein product [Pedinophyceae sp. YPF-701]